MTKDRVLRLTQGVSTHLIGLWVAAMFVFDKGLAYAHIWIGPIPLFITEIVLLILFVLWLIHSSAARHITLPDSKIATIFLGLFWLVGLVAVCHIFKLHDKESVIYGLKKSALFYYSAFAFFTLALVREKSRVQTVLHWMAGGAFASGVFHVMKMLYPNPDFWPASVIIANDTAWAFGFIYCLVLVWRRSSSWFTYLVGDLSGVLLLYTNARSALLAFFLICTLLLIFLIMTSDKKDRFGWVKGMSKMASSFILVFCFFIVLIGPPGGFERFGFINGIQKFIMDQHGTVEPQPIAVRPASIETFQPIVHAPNISDISPSSQASAQIVNILDGADIFVSPGSKTINTFFTFLDKYISTNGTGGNVTWRLKVWLEALNKGVMNHFWMGAGVTNPFVSTWVTPYKGVDRVLYAISLIKQTYNFYGRLKNEDINPSHDIEPGYPTKLTPSEEKSSFYSYHWYDIDLHNSHIAIFYRFGFLGFLFYGCLFLIALVRSGLGAFLNDKSALILFGFLLWFLVINSFNVVLEGPFLGSIFWIVLGLTLRKKSETGEDVPVR